MKKKRYLKPEFYQTQLLYSEQTFEETYNVIMIQCTIPKKFTTALSVKRTMS